jgi:hypothetical protein
LPDGPFEEDMILPPVELPRPQTEKKIEPEVVTIRLPDSFLSAID